MFEEFLKKRKFSELEGAEDLNLQAAYEQLQEEASEPENKTAWQKGCQLLNRFREENPLFDRLVDFYSFCAGRDALEPRLLKYLPAKPGKDWSATHAAVGGTVWHEDGMQGVHAKALEMLEDTAGGVVVFLHALPVPAQSALSGLVLVLLMAEGGAERTYAYSRQLGWRAIGPDYGAWSGILKLWRTMEAVVGKRYGSNVPLRASELEQYLSRFVKVTETLPVPKESLAGCEVLLKEQGRAILEDIADAARRRAMKGSTTLFHEAHYLLGMMAVFLPQMVEQQENAVKAEQRKAEKSTARLRKDFDKLRQLAEVRATRVARLETEVQTLKKELTARRKETGSATLSAAQVPTANASNFRQALDGLF